MIVSTIRTGLVAALICTGSGAYAQQARTGYRGYELSTAAGQRAVLARIARSAKRACETDNTLGAQVAAKACAAELTAQMIANSGSPVLASRAGSKDIRLAANGR